MKKAVVASEKALEAAKDVVKQMLLSQLLKKLQQAFPLKNLVGHTLDLQLRQVYNWQY